MSVTVEGFSLLDALAWTQISADAMCRKLAAVLAREHDANTMSYRNRITKGRTEELVRASKPPRGQAATIVKQVMAEADRQMRIRGDRIGARRAFETREQNRYSLEGRLNHTYAASFGRPLFASKHERKNPHLAGSVDHDEWEKAQTSVDHGDHCKALLIWREQYLVALTAGDSYASKCSIRVKHPCGKVVVSELDDSYHGAEDIVTGLTRLADAQVRQAWLRGHRVEPDYARRVFILHLPTGLVERPWLLALYVSVFDVQMERDLLAKGSKPFTIGHEIKAVADGDRDVWLPGWDEDGKYRLATPSV